MRSKPEGTKPRYSKPAGLLLVFASLLATVVLYVLDITFLYEPKHLLGIANSIFTAVIPVTVAFFAARTYLRTGSLSVLLMGCGMLGFGLCAGSAGWLREIPGGANFNVTVYNTGALLGSLCHVTGAVASYSGKPYRLEAAIYRSAVIPAYSAIILFTVLFSFATVQQIIPPFFIQGSGPTALRQIVLGLAIFFYALSSLFFMDNYFRIKSDFSYWYSLCLAMLALGLFSFYVQKVVGSPVGWVGRTSNYVGTIFSLIAILTAFKSGKSGGLPLEEVTSSFFVDAEANYKSLVETASDAIISFDQEQRVILWNSSAEQIFGYKEGEAIGSPLFGMFIPEEHANDLNGLIETSQGMSSQRTVEIVGRHKNGGLFPIELSAFTRKLPNGRVSTCIVRDITERKRSVQAVRDSEAMFRSLFENMTEGVALHQVVYDEGGTAVDYRILTANPAFEKHTGLAVEKCRGQLASILYGTGSAPLLDVYAKTAHSGEPCSFETCFEPMEYHFHISVSSPRRGHFVTVFENITERKRVDAELRENQSRLDLALRSAQMGVWRLDLIKHKRQFDDQVCHLLGIDPAKFTGAADEFYEAVHPDDREMLKVDLARTIEQGRHYETEYRAVWPDGSVHSISARGKLVRDDKGRPLRINGLIWDLTEQKQADETLRITEQRFHKILSSIFVGVLVVTEDNRIEFANQNFCDHFHITEAPSDLIGLAAKEMLRKVLPAYADPEANSALIRQILSHGHPTVDEEVHMRDGRVLLRDHIPILVDGKPWGRMWQHRDISERKRTEEELRKSRDELESRVRERTAELVAASEDLQKQAELLNLARDAIFVRDLDHSLTFWNKGAEELYGFSEKEALGKVAQDLLHTGFPEPIEQIADHVLKSGQWEGELRQTTSTGQEILVESRWALQRGTDGEPLGFLEINRDVTARKLAEEALRSNMARLELVNAELQEFAHVASHDLQEPLRKIQTFCDMARKRCAPVLDSTGMEYLDRVLNSAGRMRQLLSDLLDFSRVAARPEPFKKIDLAKIVREAADVFEASVQETGCRIEVENMPAIEADESQMLRLFQNLIGNALKFRGSGMPHIKVYGKVDRNRVCEILVKDNGIGFDPRFAELIFKPFQRLHGRNEYDGTGMGLAICRKIVERHGGNIKAESDPGKGSTFKIRLPVKQGRWEGL